jgi:protein-disulfide isomerase
MRPNLTALAFSVTLGLVGAAAITAAAPTGTDTARAPRVLDGVTAGPSDQRSSAATTLVPVRYAAKSSKKEKSAKKPAAADAPKTDSAAIGQAVRDFLTANPDLLRSAIVEVLRNDADVKKILSGSGDAQASKPATPIPGNATASADQARIEEIIHSYLVLHPEVLQEAIAELEKRQAQAEAEKHREAVKQNAEALFNSPHQVVLGNPRGDVTFVEFFDYNCGYCKRALTDMLELMKTDPQLKVVLKEFPVLGPGSVEAAKIAAAVRMQDKTGKKYLDFHQKLLLSRGQADKARALAAAKDVGLDVARLEKDSESAEVRATIEESLKLAEALGLSGTPSYVVGPNVVVGAVGVDQLRQKVNTARCGKAEC